jgi:hypothetical protein
MAQPKDHGEEKDHFLNDSAERIDQEKLDDEILMV